MPETQHIEKLLRRFTDQRLADLQCATEDGTLEFWNSCGCLLYHYAGDYGATKVVVSGAIEAEDEFRNLSDSPEQERDAIILSGVGADERKPDLVRRGDAQRREQMLPLIHKEWEQRAKPIPVTFSVPVKEEVLVA